MEARNADARLLLRSWELFILLLPLLNIFHKYSVTFAIALGKLRAALSRLITHALDFNPRSNDN